MRYERVIREKDLSEGLALPGAVILSGGTDLMVKMRAGTLRPELLLDVTRLESMKGLRLREEYLEIGAATLEAELLSSQLVTRHFPLMTSVLRQLGSVQIRNRGTLGGNIANASPAADGAIALLLYDAEVQIVGPEGERWVRIDAFFLGPGRTVLAPGEFVRTLRLPLPKNDVQASYHKVGKRNALTIAIASFGTLIRVEQGVIREARIAVGSVAPTPRRLPVVETSLTGESVTQTILERAREAAQASISPITDVRASADYRRNVIADLLTRALHTASGR